MNVEPLGTLDLWVGIFVAVGIGAILFLALKVGNLVSFGSTPGLPARGALRQHRRPEAARAGRRRRASSSAASSGSGSIPTTYQAVVTMKIDHGYEFTTDTIASILTSGLLGEVYIGLDAGGDTKMLADGGKIAKTQSAVVLEKLIGQFLFDKAASGGGK